MKLAEETPFQLGAIEVRPAERELAFPDGRETLEPRVMEVLIVLARASGQVVSREALVEACWGGRAVTDDAINRVIYRLRRLADLTGRRDFAVETVTKVGYRLTVGPAAAATADASLPPPSPAAVPRRFLWIGLGGAAALAAAIWLAFALTPAAAPAPLTLAVMPFDDMDSSVNPDFLTRGLPRQIRDRLSRMRGLRVIADSSSSAIAREHLDAIQAGRRLGADLLLDGAVRLDGAAIRIVAELVDARTGAVAWSRDYNGPADDLAAADADISTALLEHLVQRLGPERTQTLAPPQRMDAEIFAMIVGARTLQMTAADLAQSGDFAGAVAKMVEAVGVINAILAREPENASALTLMGDIVVENTTADLTPFERWREAANLYRRALRAEPDNPTALTGLAEYYRRYDWRWSESERLFQRALAIDPNYAAANVWYTYYLTRVGRCREALHYARTAVALDPSITWTRLPPARVLKCLGRSAESDRLYAQALDTDPDNEFLVREIYLNYITRREPAPLRALAAHLRDDLWRGAPPASIDRLVTRIRAGAEALEGRPDALLALIEADAALFAPDVPAEQYTEARRMSDLAYMLAVEAAAAGATERAIDLLEVAIADRSLYITETLPYSVDEFTPAMRAHPRYQAIWRNNPALVELSALRLQALRDRQMAGILPNGRRVTPAR